MKITEISYDSLRGGKVRLVGDFDDGMVPVGRGTIYFPDGSRYEGEWTGERCRGWAEGEGVHYDANGQKDFEGHFKDGELYGQGKMYADGRLFAEGMLYIKDGKLLPGSHGTRYAKSGSYYVGDLSSDDEGYIRCHGEGTMYRADGTKEFQGHLEYGKYHGKGKLYDKQGNLYIEGVFYSDEHGHFQEGSHGTLYDHGRHQVRYRNGEWQIVGSGGSSSSSSSSGSSSSSSSDDSSGCGFSSCLVWILIIAAVIWALVHFGFISVSKHKDEPPKEKTEQVEKPAPKKKKSGKGKKNRQAEPAEDPNASTGFHLENAQPAQEPTAGSQSSGTGFRLDPVNEVPEN